MCELGCLPLSSILSIACVVAGYFLQNEQSKVSSILFWVGTGLLIIILAALFSIIGQDRKAPQYEQETHCSTDPNIKLESTKKFESQFVTLSHGNTFYRRWIFSKEDDAKYEEAHDMVLVHGITTTQEWEPLIKAICNRQDSAQNNKILSIVAYHGYGRGYSDAPMLPHTLQLFTAQISELLMALGIGKKVILVGMSMGGAIATGFAATFPHKIHKLILIGPAGLPVHKPLIAKLVKLPFVGDVAAPLLSKKESINAMKGEILNDDKESQQEVIRYEHELTQWFGHHKGSHFSLLSILRYFPLGEMKEMYFDKLYEDKQFDNENWLFLWARNDTTAPIENAKSFEGVKLIEIENANHMDAVAHYCVRKWFDEFWNWL